MLADHDQGAGEENDRPMDLNTITEVARPRRRGDLAPWREGDAWLAGGTWLFSEPQPALSRLIDLAGLGWRPLTISEEGLSLAATCRIAELDAAVLPARWTAAPLINQCCRAFLASFKIWNMATVGGNLCMALPAGPMIALTVALEGICTVWAADGTERQVKAIDFVIDPQRNALKPGELLRGVDLPRAALMKRTAFRQISLTPLGRSAALLIGTLSGDDRSFMLTVTASTRCPVQLSFATPASAVALADEIERRIPQSLYYDDVHGAPVWRRQMTLHLAEEIRRELAGEAA
jgi:CO/xanthine dehydrogenase FAD-binding subunit